MDKIIEILCANETMGEVSFIDAENYSKVAQEIREALVVEECEYNQQYGANHQAGSCPECEGIGLMDGQDEQGSIVEIPCPKCTKETDNEIAKRIYGQWITYYMVFDGEYMFLDWLDKEDN